VIAVEAEVEAEVEVITGKYFLSDPGVQLCTVCSIHGESIISQSVSII
jgi:hypothetical protein